MYSITLYTDEIDDLEEAAGELFSQAEGFTLREHTLGILMAEEDTEYPRLYRLLSERWKFPIIGCTAMAMLLGTEGYCSSGISVLLMSADDCCFAAGITEELEQGNFREELTRVYRSLSDSLDGEEKLIITYGCHVTEEEDVSGDDVAQTISKAAGRNVPLYGGLASDSFNFTRSRVFFNEKEVKNGQVMALVSGNVRPKYVCVNSVNNLANFSYEVTQSVRNQVFKLGERSFLDAMGKAGFSIDKTNVIGDYILTPFVISIQKENGDTVEAARVLSLFSHENKSGIFLGSVPEGSFLRVGMINRDDVQNSVVEAFQMIRRSMGEEDYKYHTFLCSTCAARFLALASNTRAEAEVCKSSLPKDCSLLGMYAYGEYCPVTGDRKERDYNMFHNFTFAILAL